LAKLSSTESVVVQIAISTMHDTWQPKALAFEKSLGKSHHGLGIGSLFATLFGGVSDHDSKDSHDSDDHVTERE
jgi:hypothetical protein